MDCYVGISDGLRQFAAVAAGAGIGLLGVLPLAYIEVKFWQRSIAGRGK